MGKTLRRIVAGGRGWRGTAAALAALILSVAAPRGAAAQEARRYDRGRFTVVAYPTEDALARSVLDAATARDTFPGLPRPRAHVLIEIAPDRRRFREWIGPNVPEWGAAVAFPGQSRIVLQGRRAGSDAGDPIQVLRHELAHLALHEALGDLPPRWFDEGYASFVAGEWGRDEVLATNLVLAVRGTPTFEALDSGFSAGAERASATYALAYRAVADLASLDPERGLALFFRYWKETGSFDRAIRSAYIGYSATTFEQLWQSRTRRRYGVLAVVTDLSVVGIFLVVVLAPLYIARRRRDRRRFAALLQADAEAERRERESAIEALLRNLPPPPAPPSTPPPGEPR